MFVAGWCGYVPGILVVLLVVCAVPAVFTSNFSLAKVNLSGLTVLLLVSIMISGAAASRRRAERLLRTMNEELERRVREKTAELAEVNAALQRHISELLRANADLEQFAYSASHDLQEPLRMVSIFTQMLKRDYAGKLGASADEYISYAVEGAARMEKLIKGLQSYITITAAEQPREAVDTEAVVSRCQDYLRFAMEEAGARLEVGRLPPVRLYEAHLEQLFQNLIGNGLKYRSKDAPHIRISATKNDANWIFAVRDNGIGIDVQYASQIFGVFKRLHGNDEYEGAGIGLAICQKIVERYGGRIWVESALGEGSTFFFTLPLAAD